jgi:hypothetical protein
MLAGTDPANPKSLLALEGTPRMNDLAEGDRTPIGATQHALYFQSVPGKQYEIQSTDELGGTWKTVQTIIATTTPKRVVLDKPARQAFYRVVVRP